VEHTLDDDTAPATVMNPGLSLRRAAGSGVAWSAILTVVRQVTQVVVAVILARLLTPKEYGLAAMAFILTGFVLTLSDVSLGKALVQRAEIDELDRSTVFWASVGLGFILTAGGIAGSPLIAGLFDQPKLQPLVAVLSIGFLLISLQMTQAALFQREMRFRASALRLIGGTVVAAVVAIVAAASGAGSWALIAQELAFAATSTLLLWTLSSWRPKFMFSWARLRALGGFGIRLVGARLLGNLNDNADSMLIGRFLGSAALGVYSVAFNLVMVPLSRLVLPVSDSLFPIYSRIQDDRGRMGRIWLRTVVLVVAVSGPLMLGLLVVAPEFVSTVFGDQWTGAVPVVRILAPVAVVISMAQISISVLLALGRSGTVFRYSAVSTPLTVGAFAVGLHWGVVGVATCYACTAIPLAAVMIVIVVRVLDVRFRELLGNLWHVLEATAAMVAAVLAAHWYLHSESLSPALVLVGVVAVGIAVYVPICLLRVRPIREEAGRLKSLFRSSVGRARQRFGQPLAVDRGL